MSKSKVFTYEMLVRESHLDTFQHVNNATYLSLFEEARWDFLTTRGIGFNTIHATGIGPVVLEFHISFLKELRLRENILIESEMLTFDKKIGVMRQDIYNQEKELATHAKMTFGIFDMKKRKLILPPEQWLFAMGVIQTPL